MGVLSYQAKLFYIFFASSALCCFLLLVLMKDILTFGITYDQMSSTLKERFALLEQHNIFIPNLFSQEVIIKLLFSLIFGLVIASFFRQSARSAYFNNVLKEIEENSMFYWTEQSSKLRQILNLILFITLIEPLMNGLLTPAYISKNQFHLFILGPLIWAEWGLGMYELKTNVTLCFSQNLKDIINYASCPSPQTVENVRANMSTVNHKGWDISHGLFVSNFGMLIPYILMNFRNKVWSSGVHWLFRYFLMSQSISSVEFGLENSTLSNSTGNLSDASLVVEQGSEIVLYAGIYENIFYIVLIAQICLKSVISLGYSFYLQKFQKNRKILHI